jgi:hypothetical protein
MSLRFSKGFANLSCFSTLRRVLNWSLLWNSMPLIEWYVYYFRLKVRRQSCLIAEWRMGEHGYADWLTGTVVSLWMLVVEVETHAKLLLRWSCSIVHAVALKKQWVEMIWTSNDCFYVQRCNERKFWRCETLQLLCIFAKIWNPVADISYGSLLISYAGINRNRSTFRQCLNDVNGLSRD